MKNARFILMFLLLYLSTSLDAAAMDMPQLRGVMISADVQASDLQYLGQTWNVNYVRWQLRWNDPKANSATPDEYAAWLLSALNRLDQLLPVCEATGIKVLIDLHSLPGGSDPVTKESRIFTNPASQTQFLEVWSLIASKYSNNKIVIGYDLANEPIQLTTSTGLMKWQELATAASKNIRSVDAVHTIVMEPVNGGSPEAFVGFSPLPPSISNVIYSVHMYKPHAFTHQGVTGQYPDAAKYPGLINGKMWDKSLLRSVLQPVIDFQKKYGARILVGEFSAVRWAPAGSAFNYLKDLTDIFETNGWDWTYHAFREWNGWSVEHTENKKDVKISPRPTSREKLLRSLFRKNQKFTL